MTINSLDPFIVLSLNLFSLLIVIINLFYYKKYGFALEWENRSELKTLLKGILIAFSIIVVFNCICSIIGILLRDTFTNLYTISRNISIFSVFVIVFFLYELVQRYDSTKGSLQSKIFIFLSFSGLFLIIIAINLIEKDNTNVNSFVMFWMVLVSTLGISHLIYKLWIKPSSTEISPVYRFAVFFMIFLIFIFQFYYFFAITLFEASIWQYASQIMEIILGISGILLIYNKYRNNILDIYQSTAQFWNKRIDNTFLLLGLFLFIYTIAIIQLNVYLLIISQNITFQLELSLIFFFTLIFFISQVNVIYQRLKLPRKHIKLDNFIIAISLISLIISEIFLLISSLMPELEFLLPFLELVIIISVLFYVVTASARIDQIRREQKIQQQDKKTSELLLDLYTHDLGNLLQSFNFVLPLLKTHIDNCTEKDYHKKSEILLERWNQGMKETMKLTDFLKLINKAKKLSKYPLNCLEKLQEAIEIIKLQFADETIHWNLEIEKEANYLVLANDLLFYAFRNLLENAITHNKSKEKKIDIKCSNIKGNCKISIRDNGEGFPDDFIKSRIQWEIFLKKPTKSGFGLYLTNTIIEKNSGYFTIKNNLDMIGAEAIIILQSAVFTDDNVYTSGLHIDDSERRASNSEAPII